MNSGHDNFPTSTWHFVAFAHTPPMVMASGNFCQKLAGLYVTIYMR